MSIVITGVSSMEDDTGLEIVYFDIEYNGKIYSRTDMCSYMVGDDLFNHINNKSDIYIQEIIASETPVIPETLITEPVVEPIVPIDSI